MGSTPIRFRQETMARHDRQPRPRRRISRRQRLILATTTAVVVAVGVGYFAYRAAANLPGVAMPDQGNLHIAAADAPHEAYNSDPPTSGPHLPYIAPWGVHTRPIPPPLQVHNLEDGGVLIQYNCECPDLVERLRAIVRRYDRRSEERRVGKDCRHGHAAYRECEIRPPRAERVETQLRI